MSVMRTTKRHIILINLIFVFVVILSTEARAATYGFQCITNSISGDAAIGEAQLYVEVTDPDPVNGGLVLFTFSNSGPAASSITDIYFDDGPLLGIADITYPTTGVDFMEFASPPDLAGGNNIVPPFQVSTGFSADSDPAVQPNGVNPGESVGILFNLDTDPDGNLYTFDDVINAINVGLNPSTYYSGLGPHDGWDLLNLRIGIHVQGFDGGGSESFILTPTPTAFILGMLGISIAGLKLRKFA